MRNHAHAAQPLCSMESSWTCLSARVSFQVKHQDGKPIRGAVIAKICEARDCGHGQVTEDQRFAAVNFETSREARIACPVGRFTQVTPDDDVPVAAVAASPSTPAATAAVSDPSPSRKRARKN